MGSNPITRSMQEPTETMPHEALRDKIKRRLQESLSDPEELGKALRVIDDTFSDDTPREFASSAFGVPNRTDDDGC